MKPPDHTKSKDGISDQKVYSAKDTGVFPEFEFTEQGEVDKKNVVSADMANEPLQKLLPLKDAQRKFKLRPNFSPGTRI